MQQKTTQESPELQKLDFLNFSKILHKHALVQGSAILADNLDEAGSAVDLTADPGAKPFITSPYPFKIQFWMAMLCLGGRMRVQLNLFEYELGENDVLIIEEGSIGQVRSISADCRLVVIASSSLPNQKPSPSRRAEILVTSPGCGRYASE